VEVYRGSQYEVKFLPKLKVELAVADDKVERIITVVSEAARTGEIGDGKIFVYDLQEVVRIRTGERQEGAL
jgi:nitrogen regulatory protein PII